VKTLALVTRILNPAASDLERLALLSASEVAFIQNGVYNDPAVLKEKGFLETDNFIALDSDVKARRVSVNAKLVDYAGLVEAIDRNSKVVTL